MTTTDLREEITPRIVLWRIDQFTALNPESAYSFAHIVLDDYNLSDGSINHCLNSPLYHDWLKQQILDLDKALPAQSYNEAIERLFGLRESITHFLKWLTSIPEAVREAAMELHHPDA